MNPSNVSASLDLLRTIDSAPEDRKAGLANHLNSVFKHYLEKNGLSKYVTMMEDMEKLETSEKQSSVPLTDDLKTQPKETAEDSSKTFVDENPNKPPSNTEVNDFKQVDANTSAILIAIKPPIEAIDDAKPSVSSFEEQKNDFFEKWKKHQTQEDAFLHQKTSSF